MTPEQIDGLSKARLRCNLDRAVVDQFADNDAYATWVCEMVGIDSLPEEALDSYAAQHEAVTVKELETQLSEKTDA